jgi:hypothetical protein
MALLPTRFQSLAEPRYGERMMYDGAPIMDGGYGLLGGDIMVPAAAQQPLPTAQPMTQEVAPYDLSALAGLDLSGLNNLYGMNFASDFGGGLQGGGIYPTNPDLQMLQAPLSNKGNPTAYGGNYISVTSPTQTFRLVDKNTDKVVYEGVGYEGAQEAIDRASALTAEKGAKAQWQIQTPNPQQKSGYSIVANEKRNQSTLGDIASVALPVGMAILTGGMSLPAQIAGAAMAGAAGAGLAGKDPLKAGLISGATAGLGNVTGANEAIGKAVGNVGGILAGKTAEEVTKKAAEKTAEQIVVTGLSKAAQSAGSAISQAALSQAGNAVSRALSGYKTPAEQFAEQPLPDTLRPPTDIYAGIDPIDVIATRTPPVVPNYGGVLAGVTTPIATEFLPKSVLPEPLPSEPTPTETTPAEAAVEPIVVSGTRVPPVVPNYGGALAGVVSPIATEFLPKSVLPEPLPSEPAPTETTPNEEIVVTAPKSVLPPPPILGVETALPAITVGALTAAQTAGPQPSTNDGILGTGLNLPQLISIGGVGADLLKNLLAGGDGTGTGVPYVSPFGTGTGTGVGFAQGQDMRANPNIIDYERYGFGPEAMFFQPGYGLLNSAAPAPAPQAPPAMTINPVYQPLI